MAMTRSQTSASGSRRDDKDQKESWKHLLKSRNLEELTNMSKRSLKKENKRQKLMSGKTNDEEKDLDLFLPRSYVELCTGSTREMKIQEGINKKMVINSKHQNNNEITSNNDKMFIGNIRKGSLGRGGRTNE